MYPLIKFSNSLSIFKKLEGLISNDIKPDPFLKFKVGSGCPQFFKILRDGTLLRECIREGSSDFIVQLKKFKRPLSNAHTNPKCELNPAYLLSFP